MSLSGRWQVPKNRPPAPVTALFFRCRPSTILGRVRAVIVNTVDRVTWRRTAAHVRQECFVRAAPAGTDHNAASAVVWIPLVFGIGAALHHRGPRMVLRCPHAGRPACIPVFGVRGASAIGSITPTAHRVSGCQIGTRNDALAPAVADAIEACPPRPDRAGDNLQPPKALPGQVAENHAPFYTGGHIVAIA